MYCTKQIRHIHLAGDEPFDMQRANLLGLPDIVISTPSRILLHMQKKTLDVSKSLHSLVIDEADLVLSFGYKEDVEGILSHLPQQYQTYLLSATLTADVDGLKQLVLRNPVTLKLEDSEEEKRQLEQYAIR